jgi:polysaccharide pyruvyl transferase WcaK-like protein
VNPGPMPGGSLALPWGIFGAGNIGDEAMLQGFAELVKRFRSTRRILVASKDPSHVADVVPDFRYFRSRGGRSPLRWWVLRRSDAYLIVGDTPVMDYLGAWPLTEIARIVRLARDRRKRVACLGIGTEHLLHDESIARVRHDIAPSVEHWTVRTERDQARLIGYGVDERDITIAADLAWLVPRVDKAYGIRHLHDLGFQGDRPLVGLSLTQDRWSLGQAPSLLAVVTEALDNLMDVHDVDVMLFANDVRSGEHFDTAAFRVILERTRFPERIFLIPNRYWSPQQAMSFVACCTVALTMRYHFGLFSALQGVPFVSLSRLGKLEDLCTDLGWPLQLALDDARVRNLEAMLSECIRGRDQLSRMLDDASQRQIARAWRNARSLEVVLDPASGG